MSLFKTRYCHFDMVMYKLFLLLLVSFYFNCSFVTSNSCGYNSCDPGKPNVLNVHLIPHTHDDVGWLKTVDQYFYGYRDNIQGAGVQYILDTVITALWENPTRKFSYVEMAYFYRWWQQKDSIVRTRVKILVEQGRLQFLLGGWCMNDEATTHYTAIIDQMSLGLDFLNKTFGECGRPLVSWQIDPFGHSIEQANMFADMGFDALFFMRLDYRDKDQRIREKRMEFIQSGSYFDSKIAKSLFTNVLYDSYCPPGGFCFDDKCSDDPIMDDPTLHDYNVEKRVADFATYVKLQSKAYQTNHILIPMGCDFQFQNADHNFVNIDKLIYHVNRLRKDINVIYSTPACYTLAVNKAQKQYTVKNDDFFPYASGPHSFWTGYFTSRSSLKGFVRKSNNIFQICKQVYVISQENKTKLNDNVNFMAMKMGVLQHHDAVSGTEKQQVAFDYAQRLDNGLESCENVINASLSKLISNGKIDYDFVLCNLQNISYCPESDNIAYQKPLTILLYNPLLENRLNWNRIPVHLFNKENYKVTDSNGKEILSQLIPITNTTRGIPERPKTSVANYELVFQTSLPPMGYASFNIQRSQTKSLRKNLIIKNISLNVDVNVENKFLKLVFSKGFLKSIYNIKSNIGLNITQDLRYYLSYQEGEQNSGAYIFRPTTNESISITTTPQLTMIKGDLVTEIYQTFSEWGTLVTRLFFDSDKIETEWTVGPIPINDNKGKEVVLQYQTDLETNNKFFTDSNGRQLITRQINSRFDYAFNQTEPVSGNFYPVNSHAFVVEFQNIKQRGFLVHVDRSEGVGAYRDGMMEIMLHRRTLRDDNFGVGEPLNELGADGKGLIVRGKHWLSVDLMENLLDGMRTESLKIFNEPLMLFSTKSNQSNIENYTAVYPNLPRGLNILSLENHFNLKSQIDYQILRVENILDLQGVPIMVDLDKIFKFLTIRAIEELNLSANQFLKDIHRLNWKTVNENHDFQPIYKSTISLLPGQIRTFKVSFMPR